MNIYATEPVSDFKSEPITYNYEQPLKMVVSPAMMEMLTNGMLTFEVSGHAKCCVLEDMEKWNDSDEHVKQCKICVRLDQPHYHGTSGNSLSETPISREHHSENKLVAEEKHDVVAYSIINF